MEPKINREPVAEAARRLAAEKQRRARQVAETLRIAERWEEAGPRCIRSARCP